MAGLADFLTRLGQVPDSIDTRRVPFGAGTRGPAPNMQPYMPTAQQAITDIAAQNPTRNNPAALRAMEISNKPGTFESAAKKINFGLNPEIAAGQLESQLKFDTSRLPGFNPSNQVMQGEPNFLLRGQPTNVPNFELQGRPNFPVPSTQVLSRDVARMPPVDVSSKPSWSGMRAEYNAPKYGANLGTQMGQGYAPSTDTVATATPAEDARFLGKLAGAAGTVGAALQGAPISTLARGAAVAYPAVNAAGQLFQGLSDAAAGRPNATIEASRPAREQTYRDIAAGEYGHALGSAIRATGQTGGQVLGNMLTPFGNVLRGLTGAPAAAAAPASAAPQGLSDQQFTPGGLGAYTTARTRATPLDQVVAAPPEVTVPAAAPQTSAPAATAPTRSTVNVIRGGRAPTTYDVSPGVPIGTIVRPEAPRSPAQAVVGDAMSQPLFPGDRPDQPLAVRQAIANLVKSASPRAQTAADRARAAAMTDYDLANKYELDPSPDAQAKAKVYRKRAEDMLKLLYPAASDPMRDLLRQSQEAE